MRNFPTVTKNLLIINGLAFLACYLFGVDQYGGFKLNDILGLHFFMASDFHIYQLFTYMFMHASFSHLFFNMFALWMFGRIVENVWGGKKFLFYYIFCGIGAGLLQEIAQFFSVYYMFNSAATASLSFGQAIQIMHQSASSLNGLTTVGASGAIYAVLLAFGMLFPNEKIFIIPIPVPIKAKWLVIGYAVIELVSAIATPGDQVAHLAHLGGMLFGFFLIRYWQKHPDAHYSRSRGEQIFEDLQQRWEQRKSRSANQNDVLNESDFDSYEEVDTQQDEIDAILDKIRQSGYDSLTNEEKQKLFDQRK